MSCHSWKMRHRSVVNCSAALRLINTGIEVEIVIGLESIECRVTENIRTIILADVVNTITNINARS